MELLGKKYRVVEQIGKGSFGDIYKVEKRLTKEFQAMKVEKARVGDKEQK